jgi:hypothetical protein
MHLCSYHQTRQFRSYTLYSFPKDAELAQQKMNRDGIIKQQLLPGAKRKRRQITPEEQLKDEDEAWFVASEGKAEKKANKEDGT